MHQNYFRGDIFYADLGQGVGSEQEGNRPVLIIQNDAGNRYSPTVIVAAISGRVRVKPKLPTHYYVEAECGLHRPSVILLEQIRTIDKQRLRNYIGRLPEEQMKGVNYALTISIGLDSVKAKKMILCLCSSCARNFRDTGTYILHRVGSYQSEKNICTYCNRNYGLDYEVISIR